MGSLAFWKAMSGVGAGWREGVIAKESATQKKLERVHATRMAQLQMSHQTDLFNKGEEGRSERFGQQIGLGREQLEATIEQNQAVNKLTETAQAEAKRHHQATEGLTGAQIGLEAEKWIETVRHNKEGERIAADLAEGRVELMEAQTEYYGAKVEELNDSTITGSEWEVTKYESNSFDDKGMPISVNKPAVTSNGATFVQEGSRLMLMDNPKPVREAPAEATQNLLNNRDTWANYATTYGYLPLDFLNAPGGIPLSPGSRTKSKSDEGAFGTGTGL